MALHCAVLAPSNGRAERMVRTLKTALQKAAGSAVDTWNRVLTSILSGYLRRPGPTGLSPFELMYGVAPRFEEPRSHTSSVPRNRARLAEIAAVLSRRADKIVTPGPAAEATFVVDGIFLLYSKKSLLGMKVPFRTPRWTGPYTVTVADNPRDKLRRADGRRTRRRVHARRIAAHYAREGEGDNG